LKLKCDEPLSNVAFIFNVRRHDKGNVDEIYKAFTNYKFSVPVAGLIVLNPAMDKCVMVKGYNSGSSWAGAYTPPLFSST